MSDSRDFRCSIIVRSVGRRVVVLGVFSFRVSFLVVGFFVVLSERVCARGVRIAVCSLGTWCDSSWRLFF